MDKLPLVLMCIGAIVLLVRQHGEFCRSVDDSVRRERGK